MNEDNFSPVKSLFELKFGHSVAFHGSPSPYCSQSGLIHREGQLSPARVRPKSKMIVRAPSAPLLVPGMRFDYYVYQFDDDVVL